VSYFVVTREPGPRWDVDKPMREQAGWREHADFMNSLADEGFVLLGGPVGDRGRVLLIVNAPGQAEVRKRLDDDPWTPLELLPVTSIEPWQLLLGR
jgi:uncharacterized protein YciI